ncbi:MAG: hypothetical protein ACREON_16815, partial [Gemmatimonadaceae bacterium]
SASLGGALRYTLLEVERLAVARALQVTSAMPLPSAYELAVDVLTRYRRERTPVVALDDNGGVVTIKVDVHRILAAVSTRLSVLRTRYAPKRRGRPRSRRHDPIRAAAEYGLDVTLLAANLRRTPAERLRQLDAMVDFRRRVRRGSLRATKASAPSSRRHR